MAAKGPQQAETVKALDPEDEWDRGLDHEFVGLPLEEDFTTSAVSYYVWKSRNIEPDVSTVRIIVGDIIRAGFQAVREQRERERDPLDSASEGGMGDLSMIVLFGPDTSQNLAVRSLREVAGLIERRGLTTGYTDDGG